MTPRQRKLLQLLMTASTPIPAATLADWLHVSVRSIMNDIHTLNQDSPGLLQSSHHGYSLTALPAEPFSAPSRQEGHPHNAAERQTAFVQELLLAAEQDISLESFASWSCVSLESIRHDLLLLRHRLASYEVTLKQSGNTVTILGKESTLRRLLSCTLHEQCHDRLSLNWLEAVFSTPGLTTLQRELSLVCQKHGLFLNDCLWPEFLLDLLIILHRQAQGRYLPEDRPSVESVLSPFLTDFLHCLQQFCHTEWTTAEHSALHCLLQSYLLPTDFAKKSLDETISSFPAHFQKMWQQFLASLPTAIPFLILTEHFCIRFSLNLHGLWQRHLLGFRTSNPQQTDMKQASPFAFLCTRTILQEFQRISGTLFTEADTAYLAIHVGLQLQAQMEDDADRLPCGLLIAPYFDYAQNLRRRLAEYFRQEIRIAATIESEQDLSKLSDCSLIISTVPLPAGFPIDWVTTDPLLSDDARQAIWSHIVRHRHEQRRRQLAEFLASCGSEQSFKQPLIPTPDLIIFHHTGVLPLTLQPPHSGTRLHVFLPKHPILWHGHHLDVLLEVSLNPSEWQQAARQIDLLMQVLLPIANRRKIKQAQTWRAFSDQVCACL